MTWYHHRLLSTYRACVPTPLSFLSLSSFALRSKTADLLFLSSHHHLTPPSSPPHLEASWHFSFFPVLVGLFFRFVFFIRPFFFDDARAFPPRWAYLLTSFRSDDSIRLRFFSPVSPQPATFEITQTTTSSAARDPKIHSRPLTTTVQSSRSFFSSSACHYLALHALNFSTAAFATFLRGPLACFRPAQAISLRSNFLATTIPRTLAAHPRLLGTLGPHSRLSLAETRLAFSPILDVLASSSCCGLNARDIAPLEYTCCLALVPNLDSAFDHCGA